MLAIKPEEERWCISYGPDQIGYRFWWANLDMWYSLDIHALPHWVTLL